jgi:hypothetical protein
MQINGTAMATNIKKPVMMQLSIIRLCLLIPNVPTLQAVIFFRPGLVAAQDDIQGQILTAYAAARR